MIIWMDIYLIILIILKGRNSYAHVAKCVKDHFQASYKDIPDEKFDDVVNYIEYLKQNPI